jgi:hypothetical protein
MAPEQSPARTAKNIPDMVLAIVANSASVRS